VSGFWSKRRILAGVVMATVVAGVTCLWAQTAPPPSGAAPAAPLPVASINGLEINNEAFTNILMNIAGMRAFQQVFDLTLVQQECRGVIELQGTQFEARLKDEYNRTLDNLNIQFNTTSTMSKDDEVKYREQALNMVLQKQGVTPVEFRIGLETRANLRALAEKEDKDKITPTKQEIDDAYLSQYGERRSVHIFVLNEKDKDAANYPANVSKALTEYFKKPESERKTLEEMANEKKLPVAAWTISINAKNVDAIKDVAFKNLTSSNPISANTVFKQDSQSDPQTVIVVLDKVLPDEQAKHPKTDAELKNVEAKVKEFKEGQWMNNKLAILRAKANVKINDPVLREQFNNMAAAMQQQAEAAKAATQAGATNTGTAMPAASIPATVAPVAPAAGRGR